MEVVLVPVSSHMGVLSLPTLHSEGCYLNHMFHIHYTQ